MQLLDDGTEQATTYAADALARLANNNPENQLTMAKKLVALIVSSAHADGTQRRAARVPIRGRL